MGCRSSYRNCGRMSVRIASIPSAQDAGTVLARAMLCREEALLDMTREHCASLLTS